MSEPPVLPETREVIFVGGPCDGKQTEIMNGTRYIHVPILGAEIDMWVKRGNYPRRKPRGFGLLIYTVIGDEAIFHV